MKKTVVTMVMVISSIMSYGQQFEPKWIGQVVMLNIEGNDTIAIPAEKANVQIKTNASAGRIIAGIGNVRRKIIIRGATSGVQMKSDSEIQLLVKCRDNSIDPTTFIQIVKFEETKKERKTELAHENWLGNVSEGNMKYVSFDADQYGKSSYILRFPSIEGEFGVQVLNPENRDEQIPIFYCFGVHKTKNIDTGVSEDSIRTDYMYEYNGVSYPVYQTSDGIYFIYLTKTKRLQVTIIE